MLSIIRKQHGLVRMVQTRCASDAATAATSTKTLWCGQVVFEDHGLMPGSIDILEDTIVACHPGESLEQAQARNSGSYVQDLGEDFVLSPGLIDVHTHISALGRNWEGYETATRAAAAGGITTIIGMPLNSIPATTTLEAVEMEKHAAYEAPLFVDVGLWGGVVPGNVDGDRLERLLESPYVLGLKAFLAPLPPAAGYEAVSPQQLLSAANICKDFQKPILVHSELMTEEESQQAVAQAFNKAESVKSYIAHLESRPAQWEQDAVKVVCEASQVCRMHIVHLSDARGCLPLIQECKKKSSMRLTVETCPHYLLLDQDLIQNGDTKVKCFPPIRDSENRELLWRGLKEGWIDMIASDHSPCEPDMRMMDLGDLKSAWGGLSGLQYQLHATWTEAIKRGSTPVEMANWWSLNPANLVGMPNKGTISNGQQADLCWWDPNHEGAPHDYSREYHRWTGTTYFADNNAMRARVLGTWVRGELVYEGENDQHREPRGKLLESKQS